jgi:ABC-type bacteriocin/lantibiotic exporter with double-glycine peptidase domain
VRTICLALLAVAASGCVSAYQGTAEPADPSIFDKEWSAAKGVPVILQGASEDCGAAALAMVLSYYGKPVAASEIESPRADALRDFARARGFEAHCISATAEDIAAELAEGRPVLVGVVKPRLTGAVAHYEVVVGISDDRVATIDPARGLTVNSWEGFLCEWSAANRLAIAISPRNE